MTTLKIAYLAAVFILTLAGPANAKSLWTEINDVSPRSGSAEFVEHDMSKVFVDIGGVAPRSGGYFDTLGDHAP